MNTIVGNGSISIVTVDDHLDNGDNTLTIQLTLTGGGSLSASSFSVKIYDRPEFISGDDANNLNYIDYNIDSYRAYVNCDAETGTAITVRGNIDAKGGNLLRYRLLTSSPYFSINALTGVVTLSVDASEFIANENSYSTTLTIQAYLYDDVSGTSGGCDNAQVNISFSNWSVNRNQGYTASAIPNDGCTIAMLAQDVGFEIGEFRDWLTINSTTTVELFDGTQKLVSQLQASDVLASSNLNAFAVPNTIYSVWCWNPADKNSSQWNMNQSQIAALGFKIVTFYNDAFALGEDSKSTVFESIKSYSQAKTLHGLYLTGHGSESSFGSQGSGWNSSWGGAMVY